jgi:mRNA interferase MazF
MMHVTDGARVRRENLQYGAGRRKTGSGSVMRGTLYTARMLMDEIGLAGGETQGIRPVLVVSNNTGNACARICTVVPLSSLYHWGSGRRRLLPTHVLCVRTAANGLARDSVVLCEQPITMSQIRLGTRIGRVDESTMCAVDAALKVALGLTLLPQPTMLDTKEE